MCGITGFYSIKAQRSRAQMQDIAKAMNTALTHRGPDSGGIWQDPDTHLVLAHRRLSILDLSNDGAQPMVSRSERYVISYNGEIYNFRELRQMLENETAEADTIKGQSDTAVILAAIEAWGFTRTLKKLNGMFAFALWDRKTRTLHFARDRMGKKPLYIGWSGRDVFFASELKAVHNHPDFIQKIHTTAMHGYFSKGYIEAPHCIYENIWQLPPAHFLSIEVDKLQTEENLAAKMKAYWSAAETLAAGKDNLSTKTDEQMLDEFEVLFAQCVQERMIADVPLGAFLSGGIDSASVVALMQKSNKSAVKTYTIGFEENGFNEAPFAAKIAAHLGCEHHEHMCSPQDARNIIPKLPDIYDEPFADISAIPTFLVSQFARKEVSVALSGDGGDELLGGYSRHIQGPKIQRLSQSMPKIIRHGLSHALQKMPVNTLDKITKSHSQFGSKLHKVADILSLDSDEEIYTRLITKWTEPPLFETHGLQTTLGTPHADLSFAEKMMFWDSVGYLPHNILTKVDRASMAVGLEARAPLLDTRLFEFVWTLPLKNKIKSGQGKILLRQLLKRYVPDNLFDRPKQGFSIPLAQWLREDLRDWADTLLSEDALNKHGLLNTKTIRNVWQAHIDGQGNHSDKLWTILMFQAWHQRWM